MKFILKSTNPYGEVFYFCNLGAMWPHNPTRRLIERTTSRREEARKFDTEEEANQILVVTGQPAGWEIIPTEEKAAR